ncbi:hypothetical protein [Bradyrhizobium erythrophlei]|uniref:Uncharacterized protein n=1 Tax=Bradyrhizobium erythrophlei TaxID=1437360 RepID=A0A1H4XFH2_9BRAD|nr:hypothetical protein [Bradyrhizobium erythrophlei]SED04327.1 hypothetical protein SAMN05444164_3509 [Bradyrhizobium erythrophlei]
MFELPRIRPLSEDRDIDFVITLAGGRRAHENSDRKDTRNSDYLLGRSVIELKLLDEERLEKPEAQAKIGSLFGALQPDRPVVVIDPTVIEQSDRYAYATIMQGPIRGAVRSARAQLKQSRKEIGEDIVTVLFVVNNGFTALTHEELLNHVVSRARNDTDEIDAVVVAGCYLHGDGFDTYALWPIDYMSIHEERPFIEFDALRSAWNELANRHMTEFVRGEHGLTAAKEAQTDIVFEWEGRVFVKPAIPIGSESKFFGARRPRLNRLPFERVKHVAFTVPRLSPVEYRRVRPALRDEPLLESLDTWNDHVEEALSHSTPLRPVVAIDVSRGTWEAWKRRNPGCTGLDSLRAAANVRYGVEASKLVHAAKELHSGIVVPRRYIAVVIELIGQDENNDVSRIGVCTGEDVEWIVLNARVPHFGALALAAAHALHLGLPNIFWAHDLRYAWV